MRQPVDFFMRQPLFSLLIVLMTFSLHLSAQDPAIGKNNACTEEKKDKENSGTAEGKENLESLNKGTKEKKDHAGEKENLNPVDKEASKEKTDGAKEKANPEAAKTEKDKVEQKSKDEEKKAPKPSKLLKVGNLSVPVSQEPTPLISFGQNLLEEGQFQAQFFADEFNGEDEYFVDIEPGLIYAFSDDLSIFIELPQAVRFRQDCNHSSGPEDMLIQFEYAPYTKEYYTYYDQISFVASITIPTGSAKKNPNTGIGSNSFFFGGVFSRMGINWFYFTSYGGIFTASSHKTKYGNQFLYQYGVGRRIVNIAEWLFDWMVEFDGTYSCRNRILGEIDPNSGGNIIYITPSLFISSKKSLVIQFGIGFPVHQHLYGNQNNKENLLEAKIFWTF